MPALTRMPAAPSAPRSTTRGPGSRRESAGRSAAAGSALRSAGRRLCPLLLSAFLTSTVLAAPAWVVPSTPMYPVPNQLSAPLRTLPANMAVSLTRCYALWCDVQRGWVNRAALNTSGDCRRLVALGFKSVRRTEAAYQLARDFNHDGIACDDLDRPLVGR